ncbi:YhgE/Pip domain-containing protein [Microbacterium sp. GCS4]|uniref:YhgE/Pip domain-containing protein n=1 Tax=Microbacterium sp. GCS4 TaxID=1692239 RepID=UPI0006828BB1|nr:YhgE/Pip family protein [Microbacterium sp. GCS4]KNY07791.1 membrane protein [Microbacterium sp. GCS4]
MTLPIERARSRKPITWLTILGILLLPAAVGGILVAALQNPTERLDSMTAAIVNLDEPVTIDEQLTPLGRQLAAGLVDGSDDLDSNLTWVISNEEDAADGLADGSYQAVVTIPEDFSAAATSAGQAISDGGGEAEQATIRVTTPEDGLVADDLITSQIADVAASSTGTMLSEATMKNVLVGFTTIGDQIGEAADGATQLASGARDAATGAAAIPDGATQLASGATQLSTGASSLASGLDTLTAKTREAASGASTIGQGLTAGAQQLQSQGIIPTELSAGAADVATGVRALATQCDPLVFGAQYCNTLTALASGAEGTSAGLTQVNTQATATIAGQLSQAGAGTSQLAGGLTQLADQGLVQSASGARSLASGATQLSSGATDLATGATELTTGLDSLATGTSDLAGGLATASDSLPSFSDDESTSLASVIADPVAAKGSGTTIFGPTAIPLLTAVVLWFGAMASFLVLRAHTTRTLTSRRSSAGLALRSFAPAAAIGAAQGVLVSLIVQIVAGYDAGTWWAFAGMAVLAGVAFAAVNQALVAVFGGIGRWVSALVGVLAIATGLVSTVPGWLADLGAALPTASAFSGLIAANGGAAAALVVWGVLSLVVTTVAVALRRTTSAKAALATA